MKHKNTVGAIVMAAALLVSIPLGVNHSIARLREDVESEYYYDDTGYAIYQGLDERAGTARNILTLAERYVDQDPEVKTLMEDLEYAVKLSEGYWFSDIQNIDTTVEYNKNLGEAAQALCDKLDTLELSEKDAKYPRQLMADMDAEQDKLERSSFNKEADAYNQKLARSFGYPFRGLLGLKEIATFDGEQEAAAVVEK